MTTDLTRNRKRIRLDPTSYAQQGAICSVTIAVPDRQAIFADPRAAAAAVDILHAHADRTRVAIYGYCVMPDHIHLVLGPSRDCDIINFVGQYKNLLQRAAWGLGVKGSFWQKRFWDHFLRAEEQVEQTVQYVLNNPVRKGLVDEWSGYVFSGSLVFALRRESRGQAPALQIGIAGEAGNNLPCHMIPSRRESGGQAPALWSKTAAAGGALSMNGVIA